MDFCGPFLYRSEVRNKPATKCYICLFVCFSTKAVHFELAAKKNINFAQNFGDSQTSAGDLSHQNLEDYQTSATTPTAHSTPLVANNSQPYNIPATLFGRGIQTVEVSGD
ncbi:uncharacterized protein LOC118750165 [Rhagoletis pomonella]|uniref:uncharacterized protein LOC118750165 n=1 Tax=Rhagoletis pomonella TaxID=28610 RepID=UPI00177C29A2|nr:uncharacterized protein LOC118750165 [Rhagoletis pomonella]